MATSPLHAAAVKLGKEGGKAAVKQKVGIHAPAYKAKVKAKAATKRKATKSSGPLTVRKGTSATKKAGVGHRHQWTYRGGMAYCVVPGCNKEISPTGKITASTDAAAANKSFNTNKAALKKKAAPKKKVASKKKVAPKKASAKKKPAPKKVPVKYRPSRPKKAKQLKIFG